MSEEELNNLSEEQLKSKRFAIWLNLVSFNIMTDESYNKNECDDKLAKYFIKNMRDYCNADIKKIDDKLNSLKDKINYENGA